MKALRLFSILGLAWVLTGCPKVPVTGRRSLILVPDTQVSALASDSYRDLLQKSKLSNDTEKVEMIRRVGQRIAAVANKPEYKWEFNLIDDDKTVNAFCMPGGKVAFYTGILPIAANEAGVAAVMGHEVAHAIAKHGAERLSQQLLLTFGAITLDQAMSNKPDTTRAIANTAFGVGAGLGYILPYGRMQESESDRIGLMYMAQAGYDPNEAVRLWERMAAHAKGQQPPEFLSTHPSHSTRIRRLKEWMPEAMAEYQKAQAKAQ